MIRLRHAKHRSRHASYVRCAFHTRLGHATEATSNKIGTRMKRILTCFKRALNAFRARGTYSGRISHTPETRRAFRKKNKHV